MKEVFRLADNRVIEVSGTDFSVRYIASKKGIPPMYELVQNMGMSQADLARLSGVSHSTVNRSCNGSIPRAVNLKSLADALSLPVQDVVEAIRNANPTINMRKNR